MKTAFLKLCCPGDLLFTTPAVRAVKARYPDSRLFYLTGKYSSFIPDHNPHIEKTIIVEPPFEAGSPLAALGAFHNAVRRIADERLDLVISFHRSRFAALLGLFGRAGKIIGFDTARPLVDEHIPFESSKHEVLRYLDLVSIADCKPSGMELEYRISSEEDEQAEKLLRKSSMASDFAVIAPGGGENPGTIMHTKRWPVSGYKIVADYIRNKYKMRVITVGSASEKKLGEMVDPDFNLAGETSFPLLAAVLKRASIVLANDSGPLYLASAVGTRTIGIYGPSSDDLVAPLNANHRSVKEPVWCQPCYRPESVTRGIIRCPSGTWACMLALKPGRVCDAVDDLLGQ